MVASTTVQCALNAYYKFSHPLWASQFISIFPSKYEASGAKLVLLFSYKYRQRLNFSIFVTGNYRYACMKTANNKHKHEHSLICLALLPYKPPSSQRCHHIVSSIGLLFSDLPDKYCQQFIILQTIPYSFTAFMHPSFLHSHAVLSVHLHY